MAHWTFKKFTVVFIPFLLLFLLLISHHEVNHGVHQQEQQQHRQQEQQQYQQILDFIAQEEEDCDFDNTNVDRTFLYYNRPRKTGSENMAHILQNLGVQHNFTHKRHGGPIQRQLSVEKQVTPWSVIVSSSKYLSSLPFILLCCNVIMINFPQEQAIIQLEKRFSLVYGAKSYDRHVHFINFNEFNNRPNPVWYSLIRDPVTKFESQ